MLNGPVRAGDYFVFYGLLKQGASGMPANIDLEAAGQFLGPCAFRGRMVDLGGYPGVVRSRGLCKGVVYRLDDPRLVSALDAFEDVDPRDLKASLYVRERVGILHTHGEPTGETGWLYRYNQPVAGYPLVKNGDWPLDAGQARK